MNRIRCCFVILIILTVLVPLSTRAQTSFIEKLGRSNMPERGLVFFGSAGVAAVKSDICGLPPCNNFGPAFNLGALYKVNPYFAYSASVGYVRVGATEKDPERPLNLTFQSDVWEFSGTVVINLLDSYAGSGHYRSARKRFVVPYVRGGAGIISYSASSFPGDGSLNDAPSKYDPVRDYPAITAVMPFGGGMRFRFSDQFSIAPELMYHITFTDQLDNLDFQTNSVSDHYMVALIKVMYTPPIKNKILSGK